jgi:hypothetical protein
LSVAKRGVGIKARGLSAHGFEEAALVVILNGESNGMRVTGLGEFRNWLALELQILC